jgi:ATP:ADP antiporter, AAA family
VPASPLSTDRKHRPEPPWLSTLLKPITEVHQGEAVTALLLTFNLFLLLNAYYLLKPAREALILPLKSGAELKAFMSGGIALLLLGLVPLYSRLVDGLSRSKLMLGMTLAFAAQLVPLSVWGRVPVAERALGMVFFVWVGVFNVMVVAQFWSFANDLYDKDRGERLFPLVALGGSLGAFTGAAASAMLYERWDLSVSSMLVLAAIVLVACSFLYWVIDRREPLEPKAATEKPSSETKTSKRGGFALVLSHRYLLLIALFALIYNWVNTNGEFLLSNVIKAEVKAVVEREHLDPQRFKSLIGGAYGSFFSWVNGAGLVLQTFVVSRIVKYLKLPVAFLFLPVIAVTNAAGFALLAIPSLFKYLKLAENATDYSLNNTLKQMLWLVTSADMKYKAKQAVDTFAVRLGDVCSALSVALFVTWLHFSDRSFAWLSVLLSGAWLVLAVAIGRIYKSAEERKDHLAP